MSVYLYTRVYVIYMYYNKQKQTNNSNTYIVGFIYGRATVL